MDLLAEKLAYLQDFMWDEVVIGKKLYYMETPAVIERILDDGEIIVGIEDKTKDFPLWGYQQEELMYPTLGNILLWLFFVYWSWVYT